MCGGGDGRPPLFRFGVGQSVGRHLFQEKEDNNGNNKRQELSPIGPPLMDLAHQSGVDLGGGDKGETTRSRNDRSLIG